MSDELLNFFAIGTIAEIAILLLMAFRRARGSCLGQLVIAFFAFQIMWVLLLVLGGLAENGPGAISDKGRIGFPVAFLVLGGLIVAIWLGMPKPLAAPRKRPLILDMLGCAGLGILGMFVLVMGIGMLLALNK
jgi:hypothetical protein